MDDRSEPSQGDAVRAETRDRARPVGAEPPLSRPLDVALFDGSGEATFVVDDDGTISRANTAAAVLFGCAPGELIGQRVAAFQGMASELATVEAALSRCGAWQGRLSRRDRHGRAFTTDARVARVATERGSAALFIERPTEGEHASVEARLALSIAAGRMAVWDYDLVADRITGSPELYGLLGFPPGVEPTTAEVRARYAPGERERLQAEGVAALARGERFVESEFRYLLPDGSMRWVLLRAEAILDASNRPARALGVAMDITERKLAETRLRASETRLRLAQEAADIGVWDWDLRDNAMAWSPATFRLLDLDPDRVGEPGLRSWLRSLHPSDRAGTTKTIRDAVARGRPFVVEFRLDGRHHASPRYIRSRGAPVAGESGAPHRYVGVNLDVTEERRRQERLLVLADDLRGSVASADRGRERIYDLSNDLFAAVGPDGDIQALNPAWARLLGRDRDLRGTPFLDLIVADDRPATSLALDAAGARAGLHRFEARLLGTHALVSIAWAGLGEGGTVYLVGRDVTLDRAREAALGQARKMEALGQMTGGLAHDFNNLLQAIGGYLEMIARRPGDPARVGYWAGNALLATERGGRLIAHLLAFSRGDAIALEAVPVAAVLSGLDDLLQRTLGGEVRLDFAAPPADLCALVERTQLETALLNLAINARDAMPAGGRLRIEARAVSLVDDAELAAGEYVEIGVVDTGSGMPAEVLARAFEPFFTTKGVGKGTGLGLSQVYGMARHAGGAARIESRPGKGTSVILLLRRATLADAEDAGIEHKGEA